MTNGALLLSIKQRGTPLRNADDIESASRIRRPPLPDKYGD
jgi:hypothetical protein